MPARAIYHQARAQLRFRNYRVNSNNTYRALAPMHLEAGRQLGDALDSCPLHCRPGRPLAGKSRAVLRVAGRRRAPMGPRRPVRGTRRHGERAGQAGAGPTGRRTSLQLSLAGGAALRRPYERLPGSTYVQPGAFRLAVRPAANQLVPFSCRRPSNSLAPLALSLRVAPRSAPIT